MVKLVSCLLAVATCALVYWLPNTSVGANRLSASDLLEPKSKHNTSLGDINSAQSNTQQSCGYNSCPQTDSSKLNVHIIAHTHDDVGWLKTVDQYYYGTLKRYNQVGVQHILDSVVPQLVMDETKRFIYVEMSFFSKWWNEQDEPMKDIVKRLVDEGRLEFINGGWCMNDEATVSYQSIIEQMTLGLRFLNETFGPCGRPKVGWQIDPFGHTNEQASLFAQMGFDGMFFMRIGWRDKLMRIQNKSLDFIWHADRALNGHKGSIYSNIFRDTYDAPPGFCFDVHCLDDNLVDNKKSYEYNMNQKGDQFIAYIRKYAESKLSNHILIPMGGDFQYSAAGQNFKNIDRLIKYIRSAAPDINIFYSTPSCYQLAVYQDTKTRSIRLPEKYSDFLPYDHMDSVWWSGYFSSRPSVKLIEREVVDLLQVTRLISLYNLIKPGSAKKWSEDVKNHESRCLLPLWEIHGDLQHHDAVTGTEKQHVANDYIRRATDAAALCAKFIADLRRSKLVENIKKSPKYEQMLKNSTSKKLKLDPIFLEGTMLCPQLNISQCDALEAEVDTRPYAQLLGLNNSAGSITAKAADLLTKSILLNIYNPLAQALDQLDVRLPCNGRCDLDKIQVIHLSTNETMKLNRLTVPAGVQTLPFRNAMTNYEFLFYANVPPLGYTSFIIQDSNDEEIIDEEAELSDTEMIDERSLRTTNNRNPTRSRRTKRGFDLPSLYDDETEGNFEYFTIGGTPRQKREDSNSSQMTDADRIIKIKFDLDTGLLVWLKRDSDGTKLDITQKFGFYFPSSNGHPAGAYIFRPNTTEPYLFDKPILYKMYKRRNGSLIEIHQKWADWIWQTIRVDAKKKYIEFDYVVGPVPLSAGIGREVITRYISNMSHQGVFLTDSNGRQMMPRRRLNSADPTQLGGSFYPVVSTMMLKNLANLTGTNTTDMLAILVDRPQAGTSLNEGQLEFLIHRRLTRDDYLGVDEALNEPGEDGRGLVTRGTHRLYLKFSEPAESLRGYDNIQPARRKFFKLPETPKANLEYEAYAARQRTNNSLLTTKPTFVVHDRVLDELRQESRKLAMKPIMTFDRLRVTASEFVSMISSDKNAKPKTDLSILNNSLPNEVHLLTLQPWPSRPNEILIRLESLQNPLTIHPYPEMANYNAMLRHYKATSEYFDVDADENWEKKLRPVVNVDIEYLIKRIKIVSLEELILGGNAKLDEIQRLNWTNEPDDHESNVKPNSISLEPRQIRTFLARFELL